METTSHNLRANVLGIGVSATDMNGALATIASAIEAGSKGYVCATGVHGVMEAQRDPALRSILNNSFLNLADGRPTMWVGRIQGLRSMRQVTGPNLMLRLWTRGGSRTLRHGLALKARRLLGRFKHSQTGAVGRRVR